MLYLFATPVKPMWTTYGNCPPSHVLSSDFACAALPLNVKLSSNQPID